MYHYLFRNRENNQETDMAVPTLAPEDLSMLDNETIIGEDENEG